MKITLVSLCAFIILLAGCGPESANTSVTYEDYKVDGDQSFVVGMVCVGSNTEIPYVIKNMLDDNFQLRDISPPQDPVAISDCHPLKPGSYFIAFGERKGCQTPPSANLEVVKGRKINVFANCAPSPP